jgi:hypothetical protein
MNQTRIFQWVSLSFFLFSACVDQQYDLGEGKVDENVVFSPEGINIPVGQMGKMFVEEELLKYYDPSVGQIRSDANGVLYLECTGEFPFVFPEFEAPVVQPLQTSPVELQYVPPGTMTLPAGRLTLIEGGLASYTVDRPVLTNGQENLQIYVDRVNYANFSVDLSFALSGIQLGAGSAEWILTLEYTDNFVLEGHTNTVQKTIPVEQNRTVYEVRDAVRVVSFQYSETSYLRYRLELDVKSGLVVGVAGEVPRFSMTLSANNNSLQVESLECLVEGSETIEGVIEIEPFTGPDCVLEFDNPRLELALETNLGLDFRTDVHLSSDVGAASLAGENRLFFEKPDQAYPQTRTTSYVLSPKNPDGAANWRPFDLNRLFHYLPSYLAYEANAYFDTRAVLYLDGARLRTEYKLTLPFEFSNLDVSIRDTVPDLFSEDLYDRLFAYARGNIQIVADSVDVQIDPGIQIHAAANLLDGSGQPVGIAVISDQVLNSGKENQIVIGISSDDKEKMKEARHLELVFRIEGQGAITDRDYIHVRGIRITSDDGVYFTF